MIVSSSSFAELTPQQKSYGGFAEVTICSHPTDINFCVPVKEPDAQKMACTIWLGHIQAGQSSAANPIQWTFRGIQNNYCMYDGLQSNTGYKNSNSQQLSTRNGFCPEQDAPPPEIMIVSRNGRWYAGEMAGTRCYKRCEYRTNAGTWSAKYYSFTNGYVTQFTETSSRAKSNQKLCFSEPEPSRNDQNEIYDDASCDAKLFTVFCDFIKWYRTDAELPTTPEVENKTLQIDTTLKSDHINANPNSTADMMCFEPIEIKFFIPLTRQETTQTISFSNLCNILREMSLFFHCLYLLHAALIIFRD
jgi:hypothetical protein